MMSVRERRQRRHLRHKPVDLEPPVFRVMHITRFRVERSERGYAADQHAHGVRVVPEAVHDRADILVYVRVVRDLVHEFVQFGLGRQFSVQEQIRDLEEGAAFRKLLDRISAVPKNPFPPVDVGDRTAGRSRVLEPGIVRHHSEIAVVDLDLPEIHGADDITLVDIDLVLAPSTVVPNRQAILPPTPVFSHFLSVNPHRPCTPQTRDRTGSETEVLPSARQRLI